MSEARRIILPKGRNWVTVEEAPALIAAALYPGESDADLLSRAHAEDLHRGALKQAIRAGTLRALNHAMLPVKPAEVEFASQATVLADDLARYVEPFGIEVPRPMTILTVTDIPPESRETDASAILERPAVIGEGTLGFFRAHLRPQWSYWNNIAEVSISQAAALSCDIDPRLSLEDIEERIGPAAETAHDGSPQHRRALLEHVRHEIEERIAQCMSYVEAGKLSCRVTAGPGRKPSASECMLTLPEFRRWSQALPEPYTLPDGFPRGAPAPNYPQWFAIGHAALWAAVALSLGIDPEAQQSADKWGTLDEYRTRLNAAARRFPPPELHMFTPAGRSKPYSWAINLREFAAFAVEAQWPIPGELASLAAPPAAASKAETSAMGDGDGLGTKERNNLLRLILALSVMARLPERGYAASIETQLQQLGLDGPKERAIRDLIDKARKVN